VAIFSNEFSAVTVTFGSFPPAAVDEQRSAHRGTDVIASCAAYMLAASIASASNNCAFAALVGDPLHHARAVLFGVRARDRRAAAAHAFASGAADGPKKNAVAPMTTAISPERSNVFGS